MLQTKIFGYDICCWTGGDTPTPADKVDPEFRKLRSYFFRDQVLTCGGLNLWECAGTSALDRARIFWNEANLTAWRTLTNKRRVS